MSGPFSPGLGDRIEERYELVAQLRSCGVARTFLAVDEYTGQNVALTLFDPACATPTSWADFVKVVAAAAAAKVAGLVLPHTLPAALPASPHAACDPQIDRGLDRLREQGPVPWQRALTIGERIVEVLEGVHAKTAVAHHGLTPARCLVSARDEVKLLDYGVAEFERTRTDDADYRAPGWPAPVADVRPDIHSVAVMLFELIAGTRPQPRQSLRRLVPVPYAVDELLSRALATDPQQQYADLTSFRTDLRQALALPPLQPAPPPVSVAPPVTAAPSAGREPAPIAAPEWTRPGGPRGATRPAEPASPPMPASTPRPETTLELQPELLRKEQTLELRPEPPCELRPEPPRKEQTLELRPEPPRKEQTLELRPEPALTAKESTLELQPGPSRETKAQTLALQATPGSPQVAGTEPEPREDTVVAPARTAGTTSPRRTVPAATGPQRTVQTATGAQRTVPTATGPQRTVQTATGAQRTVPTATGAQRTVPTATGPQRTVPTATGAQRTVPTATGAQRTLQGAAARRPTPASDPSASSSGMRVAAASAGASATSMKAAAASAGASATSMKVAAASAGASATSMKLAAVEATTKPPDARVKSPATSSPSMRVRAVQAAIVEDDDAPDGDRTVVARRPGAPPQQPRPSVTAKLPPDVLDAVNAATRPQPAAPTETPPRRPQPEPTDTPPSDALAAVHDPSRSPAPAAAPGPPVPIGAGPPRPPPRSGPPGPPPLVRTVVAPPPRPPDVRETPPRAASVAVAAPARVTASAPGRAARPASPRTSLKRRLLYVNLGLVALLLLALAISLVL